MFVWVLVSDSICSNFLELIFLGSVTPNNQYWQTIKKGNFVGFWVIHVLITLRKPLTFMISMYSITVLLCKKCTLLNYAIRTEVISNSSILISKNHYRFNNDESCMSFDRSLLSTFVYTKENSPVALADRINMSVSWSLCYNMSILSAWSVPVFTSVSRTILNVCSSYWAL